MLTSISRKCRDLIRLIVIGTDHARHDVHICLFFSPPINFTLLFTVAAEMCVFSSFSTWMKLNIDCITHVTLRKYWQTQMCAWCRHIRRPYKILPNYIIWWFVTHIKEIHVVWQNLLSNSICELRNILRRNTDNHQLHRLPADNPDAQSDSVGILNVFSIFKLNTWNHFRYNLFSLGLCMFYVIWCEFGFCVAKME